MELKCSNGNASRRDAVFVCAVRVSLSLSLSLSLLTSSPLCVALSAFRNLFAGTDHSLVPGLFRLQVIDTVT